MGSKNTAVCVLVSGTVGKREKKKTATGVRVPGSPISAQEAVEVPRLQDMITSDHVASTWSVGYHR